MKKTMQLVLAGALVLAGTLATIKPATADPTPTPVPVQVQSADTVTVVVPNIPVATLEAIRTQVVNSGVFDFPSGQSDRPVRMVSIIVNGGKAAARIVLGPAPSPSPSPE